MLGEFKVRNFRSLRDEQTLSFVAGADRPLTRSHCVETGLRAVPHLLRSGIIYGANASGKSTLVVALATLQNLVLRSDSLPDDAFAEQYTPFKLSSDTANSPSEFEITVLLDGVRFEYGFAYDAQRIHREHLTVYKTRKGRQWFERVWNAKTAEYDWAVFSTHFKGQKDVWRRATRPQALFLSTAVRLNSDQLKPLFDWVTKEMVILPSSGYANFVPTLQRLEEPGFKSQVLELLRAADIHIDDIRVDVQQTRHIKSVLEAGKTSAFFAPEQGVLVAKFLHRVNGDDVWFDGRDEGAGMRRLLAFIGPLLSALNNGNLLVIDALDISLHPMLLRFVLGLFHNNDLSKHGAQLLVTTHNTSLLDLELVRRDQIWFVEMDERQASKLYPLSDFSPRKNEGVARDYLHGRYGALPFLSHTTLHKV